MKLSTILDIVLVFYAQCFRYFFFHFNIILIIRLSCALEMFCKMCETSVNEWSYLSMIRIKQKCEKLPCDRNICVYAKHTL